MQIDPQNFVPLDPSGKFSDDCVVMFDDGNYEEQEDEKKEDEEMQQVEDEIIKTEKLRGT